MNYHILERAETLLRGRYYPHEVVSILEIEYPQLDEFQIEDLPKLVANVVASLDSTSCQ